MRLIIASRKSDLARIQAYSVGEALKRAHSHLEIIYQFRESLGDKNLADPLWQMPEKGVFTQDFHDDLVTGKADLVVHSWKDLPIEGRPGTEIAATLPRADMRDLFLFRQDRVENVRNASALRIYSSSPRRAYNLESFFKAAFPIPLKNVTFETVRGNVPTRLKKLLQGDIDGLIVAKAAIDRLLMAPQDEFQSTQREVREALKRCFLMILPLRQNPAAAAQGALAIEVSSLRQDVKKLLRPIHDKASFHSVMTERGILASLGGGCHQKIGVSCLERDYGAITIVKALTDEGVTVDRTEFRSARSFGEKVSREKIFPIEAAEQSWFERIPIPNVIIPDGPLWIAKAQALPEETKIEFERIVWASGWETWKGLAKKGVWVTGSSESLGETENPRLDTLLDNPVKWIKLTHEDAGVAEAGSVEGVIGTYRLIPKKGPSLEGKTHFYWMSGSSFERALAENPWIKDMTHACGPGNTYQKIRMTLGSEANVTIFPSHPIWLKEVSE